MAQQDKGVRMASSGIKSVSDTPEAVAVGLAATSSTPGKVIPLPDELHRARAVQRSLLPQASARLSEWSMAGCCSSAGPIGGDFYDIFPLSPGVTMLVIADVMGKGIPAALIASVTRTVIRMAVNSAGGPAETFARANELLYEDLSSADMFVTAQAVWLDAETGTLKLSGAGHCPLLLKDKSGLVRSIAADGIPIGVAARASYSDTTIPLDSIASALMFTDGVSEARNPVGALFGLPALERWFSRQAASSAERLKESLFEAMDVFQAGRPALDDQTALLLTRETP